MTHTRQPAVLAGGWLVTAWLSFISLGCTGHEGSDIAGDHIQDLPQPQPLEHQRPKENGREAPGASAGYR
ncbi:MAG: hypothetical protein M3461_10580 [Pseudomonadota bacterium]|nr:hypothetical protein [Pseudomonadota bacterium]